MERGDDVSALVGAIEMAFRFQDVPGDEESVELGKILRENEAKDVVQKVCGLTEGDKLFKDVLGVVEKVQRG